MKKISLVLLALLTISCASKNKVEELNPALEKKVSVSGDQILGLNNKGEPILQQKSKVNDELRYLIWQNNESERELSSVKYSLKRCRFEIADPRLGGNGEVAALPSIDNMKDPTEVREQMGLVDDEIVTIKEENLQERLKNEKKYGKTLEKMLNQLKDLKENCEYQLGFKRTEKGLPATRYQGKITVTPDGKVGQVLEKHENNLDDAFEIKREKAKQRTPASMQLEEDTNQSDFNN